MHTCVLLAYAPPTCVAAGICICACTKKVGGAANKQYVTVVIHTRSAATLMSFLPRISCRPKKVSSRTQKPYRDGTRAEELLLPTTGTPGIVCIGNHGDEGGNNGRPRTATLNRPRVLDTLPVIKSERAKNSPFIICHLCGREFGSTSIGIHLKQCQQKLLVRHGTGTDSKVKTPLLPELQLSPRLKHSETSCKENTNTSLASSSWEPFSCKCQFCGCKYGKHSVAIHEGRCPQNPQVQKQQNTDVREKDGKVTRQPMIRRSASIVSKSLDVGFISAHDISPPPRPETRTLNFSSLRLNAVNAGHSVPCEHCGKEIAADRVMVHSRTCKPSSQMSTENITFPTLPRVLRTESGSSTVSEPEAHAKVVNKPSSVVCYICGREYGTKSIAIHQPQCLKKWKIANSQLPINYRKPLPRKLDNKLKLTRLASTENSMTVQRLPEGRKIPDEVVEGYFQHCYAEFEEELLPCKKCGRTFAPERHVKHIPNCNAKPLPPRGK